MLIKFASSVKDSAIGMALKSYLNDRFAEYGEILECQIDTAANRLTLKAMLKGEVEAIHAAVERYVIEEDGADNFIVLKRFSCSRPWVELLLNRFLNDQRYKLPSAVASFL